MSAPLAEALAAARAELERLKVREAESLERSGLRETVQRLTAENQLIADERKKLGDELDRMKQALAAAREQKAMLELQIKGARARVQKLTSAVGGRR